MRKALDKKSIRIKRELLKKIQILDAYTNQYSQSKSRKSQSLKHFERKHVACTVPMANNMEKKSADVAETRSECGLLIWWWRRV